jgi:hypothetical protein
MGGGKSNHLDMIVDLGLLSQSTKSWAFGWLEREIYEGEALALMEEGEKLR